MTTATEFIRIRTKTKEDLIKLKIIARESYDDVIRRLIDANTLEIAKQETR